MNKKRFFMVLLLTGVYLVLLYLFTIFESSQGITFGEAMWYSLATLSTVGYGDVVPKSPGGMLVGGFFAILSTFLLALIVGVVLSLMRGSLLPMLRLAFSGGKTWCIFEECTPQSRTIGHNLQKESPRNLIIFTNDTAANSQNTDHSAKPGTSGIHTALSAEAVIRRAPAPGQCLVFCMADNGFRNYQRALSFMDSGAKVCCLSEYVPDRYPPSLTLFHPYISCARQYWEKHPVLLSGESIVLIGSGRYAEALLEQALCVNVFHPGQQIRYLVYGDFRKFRLNHPYLSQACTWGDTLTFASEPWNSDHTALKEADRIILCFDDEMETLAAFADLHKYVPTSAAIYARLSQVTTDLLIPFGSPDELLTPENVLHRRLEERAKTMHEIYLKSNHLTSPRWEDLDAFTRRSNLSSADHVLAKVRILLGDPFRELTQETMQEAFVKWQNEWPQKKDFFRRVEHERWMRFHLMNNWQYSEVRDDRKRLHPSLLPFDRLDEKEQAKDDYAWELLGELARS